MQTVPAILLQRCMLLSAKGCMQQAAASSLVHCSAFSSIPTSQHQPGVDKTRRAMQSAVSKSFAAGYASSTEVMTTLAPGENSWSKFRAPYGFEQKSSLGPAMYLSIAVFGFSMYLNDVIYHPPRVVTMLGLLSLLLYVRRTK